MKISIITVCRNAERTIENTIRSVTEQTYQDIEYIIIDGASEDHTVEAAKRALGEYRAVLVSEPDCGIYDAMNKGIRLASGDYIHFLNADDVYCDRDVVSDAAHEIVQSGADGVYGHIVYLYTDGGTELRRFGRFCASRLYFATGDCINHQALFASAKLFAGKAFDTGYRICADREWMMRAVKGGAKFAALDRNICVYSLAGFSMQNIDVYREEAARCLKAHFPALYPLYGILEFFRNNRVLAGILHGVYRFLFIRKNS